MRPERRGSGSRTSSPWYGWTGWGFLAAPAEEREGAGAMEAVIAAVITGSMTLAGVLIANSRAQAVTDTKLEELTREVRAHNNFSQRVPVLEEQIKAVNRRLANLEDDHK